MIINKETFKEEVHIKEQLNNNEFISLGDHCVISLYLKKYNFKQQSYPFDWIVSNLDILNHVLQDDFSIFINNPSYYNNYIKSGKIFYHHSMDTDKEYFQRCISRFHDLATKNCTFFISISHTGGDNITKLEQNHREYQNEDYINVYKILTEKYKINCKLIIIHIWPGQNCTNDKIINSDIHLYNIYGKLWGGILNTSAEKELLAIFNKYKTF